MQIENVKTGYMGLFNTRIYLTNLELTPYTSALLLFYFSSICGVKKNRPGHALSIPI